MFSLLLRPNFSPARCQGLSLVAGLAVRDVIGSAAGAAVRIKWPNDVLADGKKVAGVLVETQLAGSEIRTIIVGIGLNVHTTEFPPELQGAATSLALLGAEPLERESVLVDLMSAFEKRLAAFETAGLGSALEDLSKYDALRGRRVAINGILGVACGVDERGALLLKDDQGKFYALNAGHVVFA